MRKLIGHIIIMRLLLLCPIVAAQPGFYVPKTANIFFAGDTATILDVINEGIFGMSSKSFVNFAGNVWTNDPQSLIVDETYFPGIITFAILPGSWVRFMSPNSRQTIKGGYNAATKTGPGFTNVEIKNPRGLELSESSLKIRSIVRMSDGLVYLSDHILSVGNNNPGVINGYDSTRFFVTGNGSGGGLLLRENISKVNDRIVFPIGSHENSYTPLAVQSKVTTGDDYFATVFDTVKTSVFNGDNINTKSVNKVWELGKRNHPNTGNDEVFLQHLNGDEGNIFNQNRGNSFVAQYNDTAWETEAPQFPPDSGYITTGTALTNSSVNNRVFLNSVSNSSYFTKFTGRGTKLWFTGWRVNTDLVHLNWRTQPETGLKYFIVQRRLSNETDFSNRDTVLSQVPVGLSDSLHVYDDDDPNSYAAISFYRLKLVSGNNVFTYSPVIAIGNSPGTYVSLLWPNPSPGLFYISLDPRAPVKKILVTNAIGQKIMVEDVNGRTFIQMGDKVRLAGGSYLVSMVSEENRILETKKLIIINE